MALTPNMKGGIAVGVTLLVIGAAYLAYRKYSSPASKIDSENFSQLQANIGFKANKEDVVVVNFNEGENSAQFYTNNRVVIFNANKQVVVKGTYSDGGKKFILDNGKVIESGSVWANLADTLKK